MVYPQTHRPVFWTEIQNLCHPTTLKFMCVFIFEMLSENICCLLFHDHLLENCIPEMKRTLIQIIQKISKKGRIFLKGDFSAQQGWPRELMRRLGLCYLGKLLNLISFPSSDLRIRVSTSWCCMVIKIDYRCVPGKQMVYRCGFPLPRVLDWQMSTWWNLVTKAWSWEAFSCPQTRYSGYSLRVAKHLSGSQPQLSWSRTIPGRALKILWLLKVGWFPAFAV